uniref:Uncharacterized protein n=1 Tax=Arundo donax TaxID=35708 RepID=A0A0A9BZY1_ARUDO
MTIIVLLSLTLWVFLSRTFEPDV